MCSSDLVASGSTNLLKYRTLVDNVRDWFTAHPVYDSHGQPIVVPDWNFPGRGRVQKQLTRAKDLVTRAERTLQTLPLRGTQAPWSARLEERRGDIERALEYVELYGLYTECEAIYQVDNLLSIHSRQDADDRVRFALDPRVIDWPAYISTVHLPSVVQHARVKTSPGRTIIDRSDRLRRQVLDPGHLLDLRTNGLAILEHDRHERPEVETTPLLESDDLATEFVATTLVGTDVENVVEGQLARMRHGGGHWFSWGIP